MFTLNLGCGNDYIDGAVNVDMNEDVKCDMVLDIENDKFPWINGTVDQIIAKHVVEHIWKRDQFMNKCWEVLKCGGTMYIETPTAGTVAYWKDPTHVSGWIEQTFKYYAEWNTCPANQRKTWKIRKIETVLKGDENEHIICILEK